MLFFNRVTRRYKYNVCPPRVQNHERSSPALKTYVRIQYMHHFSIKTVYKATQIIKNSTQTPALKVSKTRSRENQPSTKDPPSPPLPPFFPSSSYSIHFLLSHPPIPSSFPYSIHFLPSPPPPFPYPPPLLPPPSIPTLSYPSQSAPPSEYKTHLHPPHPHHQTSPSPQSAPQSAPNSAYTQTYTPARSNTAVFLQTLVSSMVTAHYSIISSITTLEKCYSTGSVK